MSDEAGVRSRSIRWIDRLADDSLTSAEVEEARDQLVRLHLPLVQHCARRFGHRGEPYEDLVQVGTIGLLHAVDRFDRTRGVEFSTYATPLIIGEIKRHFRDKGWAIRVPRRLQELRTNIAATGAELTQALGRSPTPRELAAKIGCSIEEIVECLESRQAYAPMSLEARRPGADSATALLDTLGLEDESLTHVDLRESLRPLIDTLPDRERQILMLRFFENMTQTEIAAEIGISQMHVSRLLRRILGGLRAALLDED